MSGINKKHRKAIITGLSIVLSIFLAVGLSGYFIMKNYINKMNLITSNQLPEQISQLPEELLLSEETRTNTELPDTDSEEILSLKARIRKNMEDNSTPIKSNKNVFNILLIGSDSRTSSGKGRSDAMILISINKYNKKIIATSILRDIYLKIPGRANNRINAAYAYGGAELLMDTIEQNLKIQIDRYASTDFYSFIDLINQVGGIEMEITEEDMPIMNTYIQELNNLTGLEEKIGILVKAGIQHLDGKQALSYIRNRYSGTDFERTKKQRAVLQEIFQKIKRLNIKELKELLNLMLPKVTTNLTEGEIFSMILGLPVYAKYDVEQWGIPTHDSYSFLRIRGMEVLGIDFEKNIEEIQKKIYTEE
jgi:LCP family protein required for cell wall assembly